MKRQLSKSLSIFLALALLLSAFPYGAFAYYTDTPTGTGVSFVDSSGKTITPDASWEETFPYGTFAFSLSSASVAEGENAQTLSVYRLGGTKGRATAYITYVPAVAEIEEGVNTYANAAGANDLIIQVEDPLSIARYQPVGKNPDPKRADLPPAIMQTTDEDGSVRLSVDINATSYQWYILNQGYWEEVIGATGKDFLADPADYEAYDFRSVYTIDGVAWSTDSAKGTLYRVPTQETLEPIPSDLDLNPEITYTALDLQGAPEGEFAGHVFELIFAEGEWVKDIIVTAVDDELAEPDEFGIFTIVDNYGGSLYDTANTLALRVIDDENAQLSTIGFEVTDITVDKSAGSALLSVKRTGGKQKVLSVNYSTSDGTATSGKDYSASSGQLMFYSDVDVMTIEVPLIDDGIRTEELVSFTVTLSKLLGDDESSISQAEATVNLYNTATSEDKNLATLLTDTASDDVSGSIVIAGTSITPAADTIHGTEVEEHEELVVAEIEPPEEGEIGVLTYNYPTKLSFSRGANYNNWKDWVYIASNSGTYSYYDVNAVGGYQNNSWTGGSRYGNTGWQISAKGASTITTTISNMPYLFKSMNIQFNWRPQFASDGDLFWYGLEYTYPFFRILTGSGSQFAYSDSGHTHGGSWSSGYKLNWYGTTYRSFSWNMNSNVNRLLLGTARYDAHNSENAAYGAINEGVLERRIFNNSLGLRIFTANDAQSQNGIKSAPDGAAELNEITGIYTDMKPTVSIRPSAGGVTWNGKLYVGTTLDVSLNSTASYFPATRDSSLSYTVFLTNSTGQVKASSTGTSTTHSLTLLWGGMTESDLNDNYTINVVMTRKQTINIDLSPSVERITDENGNISANIDPTKISVAKSSFWSDANITYGYSKADNTALRFSYYTDGALNSGSFTSTSTGTASDSILTMLNLENLHWINFGLPAEDVILFNGVSYAGNETIYLRVSDLALGAMTFRYYAKEYLTAPSIMTTSVSQTGLFYDANGNGRIDGWFNEYTGYFQLTEVNGIKDEFVTFLTPGIDYDETSFAPTWNEALGKYSQYFLKVFYSMTPRSLTIPEGASVDDPAQVLPAFITNITDPNTYASLTEEQQSYRYIVSGKNRSYTPAGPNYEPETVVPKEEDYKRSADFHLMYTAAASALNIVDIPLGGDFSPPVMTSDATSYTWSPNYNGNLLYKFTDPSPITIANSIAGPNIPIAAVESVSEDGTVTFAGDQLAAKEKLNNFLGSFTANTTYALLVQEQLATTDEIAAANGIVIDDLYVQANGATNAPTPESAGIGNTGSFPNSEYLKAVSPGTSDPSSGMDMSNSGSDFKEFNMDMGINLPSADIGITDYVTIIMDGYEVGFSIGIPLGGYEKNSYSQPDPSGGNPAPSPAPSGGGTSPTPSPTPRPTPQTKTEEDKKNPLQANKDNAEDMGKLRDFLKNRNMDSFKELDDSYKNAKNSGMVKSSSFSVSFSMSLAFLFKFNPIDNGYYFYQFSVSVSGELEFRYQYRLTPCPIVYLYVQVGISVEIGTGMTVDRDAVERTPAVLTQEATRKKNEAFTLKTNTKAFNITFSGKLYMQAYDDEALTQPTSGFTKGFISSEGDDPVQVVLFKQDGTLLPGNKEIFIKLTALEDTTISRIAIIDDVRSDVYWNGMNISPSAYIEAGAGIGIEIMKFEVFIKISVEMSMTLGTYDKDSKTYEPFSFDDFALTLGLGFRVVLLVFTYEMDLISYTISYENGEGWKHSWSALGGLYGGDIGALSVTDSGGNTYPVRIKLPGHTASTQSIYSPSDPGEISTQAYDPSDKNVPFQLSGYGTSGDAFKLVDGLITGYDYKVITVGQENYLIYTISRSTAANEVDYSMLVMSRLKLTSTGDQDSYGLVNPVDEASTTPYILLDTTDGTTDDGTGDLGFSAWVDGTTIHAAWVSYATTTAAAPATAPKPADTVLVPTFIITGDPDLTVEMNDGNYTNSKFVPTSPVVIPEPTVVAEPVAPTAPASTEIADPPDTEKYPGGEENEQYKADLKAFEDWQAYRTAEAEYLGKLAAYNQYLKDRADYEDYLSDKAAYDVLKAAYDAWYAYFDYNYYTQSKATAASKNTVVKSASFVVGSSTSFSAAETISGAVGSHVFLPDSDGAGNAVFFAEADHYDDDGTAAREDYSEYLDAIGITGQVAEYRELYQGGLYNVYGDGNILNFAVKHGSTWIVSSQALLGSLNEKQLLDNIEVTEVSSDKGVTTYYLAYTTSQAHYEKDDAGKYKDLVTIKRLYLRSVTVDTAAGTVAWGTAKLLRTLQDFDNNTGADGVGSTIPVGVQYKDPYFSNLRFLFGKLGNSLADGETLSGLSADSITPENFLLFEMNGSTYVIKADSLASIVGSGSGTIHPFFKAPSLENASGEKTEQSTSGRAEVTIGADGAGNISAVYVGTVPNTTNNALFLTKFDPNSGLWGTGTMLAMNHMEVYEESIAQDWTPEETHDAYFTGPGGGMDQFKFSNLQIALGQKAADSSSGAKMGGLSLLSEDEVSTVISAPADPELMARFGMTEPLGELSTLSAEAQEYLSTQSTGSTRDTLLVLTQGTLTYLEERMVNGKAVIVPMSESDALAKYNNPASTSLKPGVGVYAVSYGVGGQRIGEVSLKFVNYDFTAGSKLRSLVSFVNTGDVAIRGSATYTKEDDGTWTITNDHPITIKLMVAIPTTVEGNTTWSYTELDKWVVRENILSGQDVRLNGTGKSLVDTLPTGSIFYLTVEEDAEYIGSGAFSYSTLVSDADGPVSGNLTVAEKPELGFESFRINSTGIDASGNTILDVEFQVGNRGNAKAVDAYVQFTYEDGLDSDGKPTNAVLPLTMTGTNLNISKEEPLTVLDASTAAELADGILYLFNSEDGGDISPNKGRTVSGTLVVPPSVYKGGISGSLNLSVEIFSSADTNIVKTAGVISVDHGEYYSVNNTMQTQIEHITYFVAADKITLALGNTMRLPVSAASTTGSPQIVNAIEMTDGNDGMQNLGVLYYSPDNNYSNGHSTGTIVIAPTKVGDGVIHLVDIATNTIYAIAYTVTSHAEGINIFNNDSLFTFYNSNGSTYDITAPPASQNWEFRGNIPTWGTGTNATTPYLENLSYGNVGSYFTFRTVAESISLYFNGKVEISSTFPGFNSLPASSRTLTADGGTTYATIKFGDNPTDYAHTVTIKVLAEDATNAPAQFDRVVEVFSGDNEPPTPSDDKNSPQIYWSRSFPETASIDSKLPVAEKTVAIKTYILDDKGLVQVTANGATPDDSDLIRHNDNFWELSLDISANGVYTIATLDSSGNRTARSVNVDWFNSTVTVGAKNQAPELSAAFQVDGVDLGSNYVKQGEQASILASPTPVSGSTISSTTARYFNVDSAAFDTVPGTASNIFDISNNGLYLVQTIDADGSWRNVVLVMNRIDSSLPMVTLTKADLSALGNPDAWALSWGVTKGDNSLSPISSVTINGYPLTITADQTRLAGIFPVTYGGKYTITATDKAGNSNSASYTLTDLPLSLASDIVTTTNPWYQSRDNGSLAVDLSKITGGNYLDTASTPAANTYAGSYEYTLLPEDALYNRARDFDEVAAREAILDAYNTQYPDGPEMSEDDLKKAVEAKSDEAFKAWLTELLTSTTAWSTADTVNNLAPGNYTIIYRDALDSDDTALLGTQLFTLHDEAVTFSMIANPSSGYSAEDGNISISAFGGRGGEGTYEFALIPMEKEDTPLVDIDDMVAEGAVWQTADFPSLALNIGKLRDLKTGWYQVAVRGMYGVTAADMNDVGVKQLALDDAIERVSLAEAAVKPSALERAAEQGVAAVRQALQAWELASEALSEDPSDPALQTDEASAKARYETLLGNDAGIISLYTAWQNAIASDEPADDIAAAKETYDTAVDAYIETNITNDANTELAAANTAKDTAQTAYDTALAAVQSTSASSYASDPTLWKNAFTEAVKVGFLVAPSAILSTSIAPDGTTTFTLKKWSETISESDRLRIVDANTRGNVILKTEEHTIIIPKGTLASRSNIGALIPDPAGMTGNPGDIVVFTDADGNLRIVPWALVEDGKISFILSELGEYKIINATSLFTDANGHWAEDSIIFTAARGLFQGTGPNTFSPNTPMTRGMFVTVLGRLVGIDEGDWTDSNFTDVPTRQWYSAYVQWANANGIVTGYGNNTFGPNTPITREQMAVIFVRFMQYYGIDLTIPTEADPFRDDDSISSWARKAIAISRYIELINGLGDNLFNPQGPATRAQVSTLFERLIRYALNQHLD